MYSFFFRLHSLAASRFFKSLISRFLFASSPVPWPPDKLPATTTDELLEDDETGRMVYA